jgi:transcriptional regulator with XRE-family HTH domain
VDGGTAARYPIGMPAPARQPDPVGTILRTYRLERGLTQEVVAARAGLDRNYIGMIERGERRPTVHTVTTILRVLKISWRRMGDALAEALGEADIL